MKYVLDTNAVSALMKGSGVLIERLKRIGRQNVAIPQPVLAELAYGIERLPKSKRREDLRRRLDTIRDEIVRIAWTDDVSERFGSIKAALERRGERIEDFDVAIAAHALARSAVLVSTNVEHMARVPDLVIEDWAEPPG